MKTRIMSVVGARPNFMKIAPFVHAIRKSGKRVEHRLVHTGQHYDEAMSASFFRKLDIPEPDVNLGIGSGTHAEQVGRTMIEFEKVVKDWRPDWIVVLGDVNATCACSIVAKKERVKLAHIEAGLRSFDLDMPEEINRMVTDRLSDLLFTPDELSSRNLRNEGVAEDKIKFVGNIMIDTLEKRRVQAESLKIADIVQQNNISKSVDCGQRALDSGLDSKVYGLRSFFSLLTLHRPSNVDSRESLEPLVRFFVKEASKDMPLVWALHPRTRGRLEEFGLWKSVSSCPGIVLLNPVGYHEMLKLNMSAKLMFTDSGGLQEECCVLGTPCLTLRFNTERPVTLREHGGVCELVGNDIGRLRKAYAVAKLAVSSPVRPPLWDGKTAERIAAVLMSDTEASGLWRDRKDLPDFEATRREWDRG